MKQIKEKPERIKGLKEHVRSAPKEMLRRSVNAGAERMKEQLRDSRQQEQPEDYASEKVETAAEGIPSAAVYAVARLNAKKKVIEKKAREVEVKTKGRYIQQQAPASEEAPPQALVQGKQAFQEKRYRQTELCRVEAQQEQKKQSISTLPDAVEGTPQSFRSVTRNVRLTEAKYSPAVKPSRDEVKTVPHAEIRSSKAVGRTPKQAIKTADIVAAPSKSVQTAKQAKNLAVKTIRSTQRVAKEAAAAVVRAVSSALGALLAAGGGIAVMIILVVVLFGGVLLLFGEGPDSTAYTPVSEEVQAYEPLIRLYAEQYGIPDYVDLIKAIMMTESGGKGSDPMQASESGFNTKYPHKPSAITDPEYSIDVGVQTIASVLKQAEVESPLDLEHIKLALQGYNFGNGYISWALDKYGGYSEANAIEFSEMMAKQLGWKRYGSTKYVSVVLQYYPYGYAIPGAGSEGYIWPLPGYTRISSPFGYRICPYHGRELHGGVDLPAPLGTNILAAQGGTVVVSTYGSSYGNHVAISHPDGSRTMYCHMSARLVSVGDTVSQGQVIGRVGSTGNSTGNHLHFEVWTNGNSSSRVNPMDYF